MTTSLSVKTSTSSPASTASSENEGILETTGSKSRLNFLSLLQAGHADYVVNDEALAYMRHRALAAPVIAHLAQHQNRCFADQGAWTAHLETLGITVLAVKSDPVTIATEGPCGAASRPTAYCLTP